MAGAVLGSKYGGAPKRICQPSGFAISQFAIARVSNCRRESLINAREIGTPTSLALLDSQHRGLTSIFEYKTL
jgi:hypothetical protein